MERTPTLSEHIRAPIAACVRKRLVSGQAPLERLSMFAVIMRLILVMSNCITVKPGALSVNLLTALLVGTLGVLPSGAAPSLTDTFRVDLEAAIVRAVESAGQRVLGRAMNKMGDTPWMDSALLAAAGIETVVIGPSGAGAHAADEYADVASLGAIGEIYRRTLFRLLGVSED